MLSARVLAECGELSWESLYQHREVRAPMARNLGWKMVVDSEQGRRLGAAAGGGGGRWEGRSAASRASIKGLRVALEAPHSSRQVSIHTISFLRKSLLSLALSLSLARSAFSFAVN